MQSVLGQEGWQLGKSKVRGWQTAGRWEGQQAAAWGVAGTPMHASCLLTSCCLFTAVNPLCCLPAAALPAQVFLRAGKMAEMDKRKTEVQHGAATTIQRAVRGYLARKHFAAARRAAILIQAAVRGMAARSRARAARREKAATLIQAYVRRWRARRDFCAAVHAAVAIQAVWRGAKARAYTRDIQRQRAAVAIQAAWRGHRAQAEYRRYRHAVVVAQVGRLGEGRRLGAGCTRQMSRQRARGTGKFSATAACHRRNWRCAVAAHLPTSSPLARVQSLWRAKAARRELRQRRAEAREAGKLLQDKQALESKLREVQNVLETVQGQRNELRQQYRVSFWGIGGHFPVGAAARCSSPACSGGHGCLAP